MVVEPAQKDEAGTYGRWGSLAAAVRDFDPSVVVLVARKAPRVAQALGLELGHRPLIITDIAIELSREHLRGARVAIVDDVINVGSTLAHSRDLVAHAGAAEISVFALARRAVGQETSRLPDVRLMDDRSLDDAAMELLSAEVPLLLQARALPYDLDFPVLSCLAEHPSDPFTTLKAALAERYGASNVHDVSTAAGVRVGIRRMTVALPTTDIPHRKVRLYVDESTGSCNVVPISLRSPLVTAAPATGWQVKAWWLLGASEASDDSKARVNLFLDSLALGMSFVRRTRDLLRPDPDVAFDVQQASWVLGPGALALGDLVHVWDAQALEAGPREIPRASTSQFLEVCVREGLLDAVAQRMAPATDELSAFITIFNVLAEWAGASDPDAYRLGWPYTPAQIATDPYLRLRIGPTFGDLVEAISRLTGLTPASCGSIASKLLDRYVDDGGVVPTTATYEGRVYRIYRKGEKNPRDDVSLRLRRAWGAYGKPLSLTRATKLATILAFSEDRGRSDITVRTEPRGNVACFAQSVLHDEVEVTRHLLRTGQLRTPSE